MDRCVINGSLNAKEGVGIGTISGYTNIICGGDITMHCSGEEIAVIGSLKKSENDIIIQRGTYNLKVNGFDSVMIGSIRGKTSISIKDGVIEGYGESTNITGIGDKDGEGDLYIENGLIHLHMLASAKLSLGVGKGRSVIAGGNINVDPPTEPVELYSPIDLPVEPQTIDKEGDFFRLIAVGDKSYSYRAMPSPDGKMTLFLPIGYSL
jgi:hypothetical protein